MMAPAEQGWVGFAVGVLVGALASVHLIAGVRWVLERRSRRASSPARRALTVVRGGRR